MYIFIDKLTIQSLTQIFLISKSTKKVFYFDAISKPCYIILDILRKTKVSKIEIHHVKNHIGHIKDDKGQNDYIRIIEDVTRVCLNIKSNILINEAIISEISEYWDKRKIELYFIKKYFPRFWDK